MFLRRAPDPDFPQVGMVEFVRSDPPFPGQFGVDPLHVFIVVHPAIPVQIGFETRELPQSSIR